MVRRRTDPEACEPKTFRVNPFVFRPDEGGNIRELLSYTERIVLVSGKLHMKLVLTHEPFLVRKRHASPFKDSETKLV